ncbi:hypothetical protein SFC88_19595 [Nocardioides sp. HM23]|uniref:hypothetical protein n=1 Tax=Nocardioides bizhenqiangii TaxID=3095076 RepID=UPI002ACA13E9|nr:hypothetical protein [Nocardioides sp. HM23]MDZ5623052.1 hypothetical protein [Nocardioides sp. HM23]
MTGGDCVSMVDAGDVERDAEALYDIQLAASPPESLRRQYPSMSVRATGARTALRQQVEGPEQLTSFLRDLSAVGLVLTDVHLLPPAPATTRSVTYEVRVAGALGDPLLRSLRCPHYAVPEQTLIRLTFAAADLERFLRACTNCGVGIEGVRRVDAPQPRSQMVAT